MTEIRFIEPDELDDYRQAMARGFGTDAATDDATVDGFGRLNSVETTMVAIDRGHVVATFGSYHLELTVPGQRSVSMAGTTHVTVHPTHRRRGILSRMMGMHLQQAVEQAKPVAGLWASEEPIYGRFGYGPAAYGQELSVPARTVVWPDPDPTISLHPLTIDEAREVLPPLYERGRLEVPGRINRSDDWWVHRFFRDPEQRRGGASSLRWVVAERNGEPVGHLAYRTATSGGDWDDGRTSIQALMALDDDARRALWHLATNVDLFRNVTWFNAPVDDPLFSEADRFRKLKRRIHDSIWVRILDVPAALGSRTYEHDGSLVLAVHDGFDPAGSSTGTTGGPAAGRYRLEVDRGLARCEPTDATADVELPVAALGRLLLGGTSAVGLRRAGMIDGSPDAVAVLHDLFVTRSQPHCPEVF